MAVGMAFPPIAHVACVQELGREGQALLKPASPSFPPMTLHDPQPDIRGTVPASGTLACPGDFGATPSLALLPNALGQVAWDESDG